MKKSFLGFAILFLVFSGSQASAQSLASVSVPLNNMSITGEYNYAGVGDLSFYTNGVAQSTVSFPTGNGTYQITVAASGDLIPGNFPNAQVSIDGNVVGNITVTTSSSSTYTLNNITSTPGNHTLAIAFTNDIYYSPSQDQNLYVQSVSIASPVAVPQASIPVSLTVPLSNLPITNGYATLTLQVISFFGNSTAQGTIDFPNGNGSYQILIGASGDLTMNLFPNMQVSLDGNVIANITVTLASSSIYTLNSIATTPGNHTLSISFTNDYYDGVHDLNLYVESVTISTLAKAPATITLPVDEREVTFPSDMGAAGWMDVTKNGALVQTTTAANDPGCPNALPNQTDAASVTQTTQAIQCRLNYRGIGNNPASIYFPKGTYYINKTLSATQGYWNRAVNPPEHLNWEDGGLVRWSYNLNISGEDPASTSIVWAGDCGLDPNVNSANFTKYNDILYINGVSPLVIERLTLDGQHCAGDGIDMIPSPTDITGVAINEMNIQNLKEVAIAGGRNNMTTDELTVGVDINGNPTSEQDGTGMVSEVTITQVNFAHVDHSCVNPMAPNAVDWWIRDSVFSDCNIGLSVNDSGSGFQGAVSSPGLNWGGGGQGLYRVANSTFLNSRTVDMSGTGSVRNSYSVASNGPFIEAFGPFFAQGNTVIAANGVVPIMTWGGAYGVNLSQLTLLQNKFITQNNGPAVLAWTKNAYFYGPGYDNGGVYPTSGSVSNLWTNTFGNVVSIGNQYSSATPYSMASSSTIPQGATSLAGMPAWAPPALAGLLTCGTTTAAPAIIDGRTFCMSQANLQPIFNLLSFDDVLGASLGTPAQPTMPPTRPEVVRNYIIPTLIKSRGIDPVAAAANSIALQTAVNALAANQGKCAATDYACADRWNILYIPSGDFPVSTTIDIPGTVQLQIVGTGSSFLYWNPFNQPISGPSAIFKFHAPSHVMMRDLSLFGSFDANYGGPVVNGEGIIAEVTDVSTSRVLTDAVRMLENFSSIGIGNAAFEMRSFGVGDSLGGLPQKPALITGNNGANKGYFAFFGGNPSDIQIGGGTNLMLQDIWYEGGDSALVACAAGDSGNLTVETSNIDMGGWHGVSASTQPTFDIGSCKTKTTVFASDIARDGWAGLGPTQSILLPAGGSTTSQTQVFTMNNLSVNSNYGGSEDSIPTTFTGSVDQGYLYADPNTSAQYADVLGTFYQKAYDNAPTPSDYYYQLAGKNTGNLQSSYMRSLLAQAEDPRQSAPSRLVAPITDIQSTDIQMYRVWFQGHRSDMQFILPGAQAQ